MKGKRKEKNARLKKEKMKKVGKTKEGIKIKLLLEPSHPFFHNFLMWQ